jgi:hypothetical protein
MKTLKSAFSIIQRNWQTSSFGILTLVVYVAGHFLPEQKQFLDGLVPVLVAGGLIAAKDSNRTGV